MTMILTTGWIVFAVITVMAFLFTGSFIMERERRPTLVVAGLSLLLLVPTYVVLAADYPGKKPVVTVLMITGALAFVLIVVVRTGNEHLRVTGEQARVDERDAVFHRFYRLEEGTPEFERYYAEYPEKKRLDERIRALPPLAGPGSRTWHSLTSPYQAACFNVTEMSTRNMDWEPSPLGGSKVQAPPEEFTRRIKGFAEYLGARSVGCTALNQAYVYSKIGRSSGKWGEPITLDHPNAIAVTVEMRHDMVRHAPDSPTTTETAFEYLEAAKIAAVLARYINFLGYEARAHVDANYRVMCVPVAVDAGLGELGRLGLLMTPELGPRVRIAIVTTDLPLEHDEPVAFGVQEFCSICRKCADICPSGSIDAGDKRVHNGAEKWRSGQESCYRYWRNAGSDCSLCVAVCPYSHRSSRVHDLVRWLIRRNRAARRLALLLDDLAYGRRPAGRAVLPDWHDRG